MSSFVLTLDHAKSKSEDVTKDAGNLQGFCVFSGDGQVHAGKKKRGYSNRALKNLPWGRWRSADRPNRGAGQSAC